MRAIILIPGSLFFAWLVMMSSAPAKSAGGARYAYQDPFIRWSIACPIQSRLQSVLGVRSFYVKCSKGYKRKVFEFQERMTDVKIL